MFKKIHVFKKNSENGVMFDAQEKIQFPLEEAQVSKLHATTTPNS